MIYIGLTAWLFAAQRKGNGGVTCRKLQCVDFLTSGGEEEQVRGAKMQPLTVVGGSGQRPVSAANLPIEISAGADSGCGFSLSNPREGRLLPSVRDAKGGIYFISILPVKPAFAL